MNIIIPLLYAVGFSWIIWKLDFFRQSGINAVLRVSIFFLKILTGVFVIYIYTNFYKNPATADILLYYQDGRIMSEAIYENPGDFFRMLSGIGIESEYFEQKYFSRMDRWYRHHESFFFNDTQTIIRFNAFCNLFSFGALHVNTVFMCFLSFSGLIALYRAFEKFFRQRKRTLLALAVFFPPALLFWSSAILKEGLLAFCMGFFVYSFLKIFSDREFTNKLLLMLLLSVSLFLINKIYILLLLFPPLLCFIILTRFNFRFKFFAYFLIHVLLVAGGLFISKRLLNKDFVEELIRHQRDFINVAKGGVFLERDSIFLRLDYYDQNKLIPVGQDSVKISPGSSYEFWVNGNMDDTVRVAGSTDTTVFHKKLSIEPARSAYYMPHLKYKLSSFLEYAPKAFLNVLVRPFLKEAENLYQKICSVENIFYILIFLLSLLLGDYKNCNWNLFWLGIFFTINLFLIIGFTTPVAGALVRYKAPALPFLLISAFSLLNVEKVRNIPVLKHLVKY